MNKNLNKAEKELEKAKTIWKTREKYYFIKAKTAL